MPSFLTVGLTQTRPSAFFKGAGHGVFMDAQHPRCIPNATGIDRHV